MWTDMTQQNPFTDVWTETAEMWTDPTTNPAAGLFGPFHEAVTLWTEWALAGFEGNPAFDPELTPDANLDVSAQLPLADAGTFIDLWVDIVESWLALFGGESNEFTSVPIE